MRIRFVIPVFAAAVAVAGCAQNDPVGSTAHTTAGASHAASTPAPSVTATDASHNAADVTFASSMIPHHQQAVEMADLAPTRAQSEDVKRLAQQIKAAQDPEIQQMSSWLREWGQPVPSTPMGGHALMPGMMDEAGMSKLEAARGAEFDRQFLTMMIGHHEGAVTMSNTELRDGQAAPAKALARSIIDSQQLEITEMRRLLGES